MLCMHADVTKAVCHASFLHMKACCLYTHMCVLITLQGIQWYDTMVSTILSNVTFENYKYRQYTTNKASWWYWNTPHAFRMMSFSDQFKPGEVLLAAPAVLYYMHVHMQLHKVQATLACGSKGFLHLFANLGACSIVHEGTYKFGRTVCSLCERHLC